MDGQWIDLRIDIPWTTWMSSMLACQGILFEHGWISLRWIKFIKPPDEVPAPRENGAEGNVIVFKKPT